MDFISTIEIKNKMYDIGEEKKLWSVPNNTKNICKKKSELIAKPFLKWAGGKGQLLSEIKKYYPFNERINKYVEPFIGGGAVLFDILNNCSTLKEIYISDINSDLINTYLTIKNNVEELINLLFKYQEEYIAFDTENRKNYYLKKREEFNILKVNKEDLENIKKAALMIFLNKTCFNGLYRVNKKGFFNVPMGAYKNPCICDQNNLRIVSKKLKNVKIVCADYKESIDFIDDKTFVYFDPPYRPITTTASFTSYTENNFGDKEQRELSEFIKKLDKKGAKILISNSDPKNVDENDDFFDSLYKDKKIVRIEATRMINSKSEKRGKINELLISNF